MTEPVKIMYKEAVKNRLFLNSCKNADIENYREPKWYDNEAIKIMYASMYYGWLIGKGLYIKSNYYKN